VTSVSPRLSSDSGIPLVRLEQDAIERFSLVRLSLAPNTAPGRRAPKIRDSTELVEVGGAALYRGVWGVRVGTALVGAARLCSLSP